MFGNLKKLLLLGILSSLAPVLLTAQNTARTEAIFPFYIERQIPIVPGTFTPVDSFHSRFEVVNPNPSSTVVVFHVFDSSGQEVFPLSDQEQPLSRTFAAYETVKINHFSFAASSVVGWVRASATQPVIVQQEILHAEETRIGPPFRRDISRTIKSPASSTRREIVRVSFIPSLELWSNTGLSIAFPAAFGAPAARGTLTLRYVNGGKFAETTVTVPANGQVVRLFSELFVTTTFPSGFGGTLELVFDNDVYVTAIQMTIHGSTETMETPTSGKILLGAFGQ